MLILKIVLIVLAVVAVALVVLMILGRRLQKKQEASKADIEAATQIVSMLIIDKKRLRAKDSSLPKIVTDQIPKYMRFAKLPLVKAKVGPKVMTLIADEKIFEALPVKTEVKVAVSGIYITEIKFVRGKVEVPAPKKKGFFGRLRAKAASANEKASKKMEEQKKLQAKASAKKKK